MKAPTLWRRKIAGQYIGAFHVTIKGKRINLHTQDAEKARSRRAEAMRGKRTFQDDSQGAADSIIAALDATPPPPDGGAVEAAARTGGGLPDPAPGASPPLALGPMSEPVIDPEPIPPESQRPWTEDVAGAADPSGQATGDASPTGGVKIADIPLLTTMFVTASRIAVQLQMVAQSTIARKVFKYDLPVLADPPPRDLAEFMAQQAQPWPNTDPREAGRAMWEVFARRVCPTEIPLPDWIAAPILVAVGTLPVQVMHGHKIDPNVQQPAGGTTDGAPKAEGAAPDAAIA